MCVWLIVFRFLLLGFFLGLCWVDMFVGDVFLFGVNGIIM